MATKREFISNLLKSPRNTVGKMANSENLGKFAESAVGRGINAGMKLGGATDFILRKPSPQGVAASNLFTGKTNRKFVAPAIIAAGVGLGIAAGRSDDRVWSGGDAKELTFSELAGRRPKPGSSANLESPMMMADAMHAPSLASKADDLGTSGSMVFGMNNNKQGGYL